MPNVRKQMAVRLVADGDNPFRITLENPTNMTIKIGQVIPAGLLMLVAHGGTGPYAFEPTSIGDTSGSSGLAVGADGQITGTASDVGTFGFIGECQDADDEIFLGTFTVTVEHVLKWQQSSPPDGWHDEVYNYQFQAIGGTGTTTYSVVSGAVPTGLDLSVDGLLGDGGIGASSGSDFNFTIRASDSGSGDSIDTHAHIHVYSELKPTIAFATVDLVVGTPVVLTKTQAGISGGLAPYQGNPDPDFPLPVGLSATVNRDGTVTVSAASAFTVAVVKFDYRDSLGQSTVSQSVHITAADPQQKFNAGDGSTAVFNPNALTFDPATFTVTDDGSGGLHVVGLGGSGGGNQVIDASDYFGHSISNPNALDIYSDDGSVSVLGHADSSGGFSWRLRTSGGGGGGSAGVGLYASRPSTPSPGDVYVCTDIRAVLVADGSGNWKPDIDPYWTTRTSVCQFNGTAGDTWVRDEINKPWALQGGAQISTGHSLYGGSSLWLPGTAGAQAQSPTFLNSPGVTAGTATVPWGFEFYLYPIQQAGQEHYLDMNSSAARLVLYHAPGDPALRVFIGSDVIIGNNLVDNAWIHIAFQKDASGNDKLFMGGVQAGSTYSVDANQYGINSIYLGSSGGGQNAQCYIQGFRFWVGRVEYTGGFTPPGSPWPIYG